MNLYDGVNHCDSKAHYKLIKAKALSDFADYVQQQQALRKPGVATETTNGAPKHEHAELDSLLDSLDLAEDKPKVRLKQLFLDDETKDESIKQLRSIIEGRLDEGHGECIFDVGLEDNPEGSNTSPANRRFMMYTDVASLRWHRSQR